MKPQNSVSVLSSMFLHVILLCSVSLLKPTVSALGNETDMFALLKFKESISNDPNGVLSSWYASTNFCNWRGIACSRRHQRITSLDLEGHDLRGTISPYIGNLSFLRLLNLMNNSFTGEIPHQVGQLFRLQHLILSYNMLEGKVPMNLSSELKVFVVGTNRLSGTIPSELGSLMKLELLNLESNNLTGGIPPSFGNMSSIKELYLPNNNLVGTVPNELGVLKNLSVFAIGPNNFSGMIPPSLYNISSMISFSIPDNQFKGTLPANIGVTLPNLQELLVGGNEFSGTIPDSFSNASQLYDVDLSENKFVGRVPASLGNLLDLRRLLLNTNSLGSNSANSWDFIDSLTNCSKMEVLVLSRNNFGGVLPSSIANLSTQMTHLYFSYNQISGNIPATLENLVNLSVLSMGNNLFSGAIPASLWKLKYLQVLDLDWNTLSGNIPSSIGNLTQIFQLSLSNNELEGTIPLNIGDCKRLQYLDMSNNKFSGVLPKEIFTLSSSISFNFSRNSLTGSLPVEVGTLKHINTLDLSENNLTDEIPETIGDCESLEFLYLQGNSFQGTLPSTLASLRGLQHLDLSQNNLTGQIPQDFEKLHVLLFLNLSFNDLEGEVPNGGVFQNTSALSIVGNTKLCGGVPSLQLLRCPIIKSKQGKTPGFRLIIIIVCSVTLFLLFSSFVILCWRRKLKKKIPLSLSTISFLSEVSYKKLYHATYGFSPTMLIGTGSFSSVYKGILDKGKNLVAIKVLNLQKKGADKSFIAECNALTNIRHRNLVKVLTCCSSMDYNGNEFKALVFEYMKNGSLEKWLHPVADGENQSGALNLVHKLNIVVDVATAVHYLHDQSHQPIIHCDLKPSNVLLDDEMIAHVSDFGLARLISDINGFSQSQTSTSGLRGTIGYAPPGNYLALFSFIFMKIVLRSRNVSRK